MIVDRSRNEKQQDLRLSTNFVGEEFVTSPKSVWVGGYKFDQGLRFVHNPTKSTKRRPLQNCLEMNSKFIEHDCRPKQKQGTTRFKTRFAVINEFDQGLHFENNPTKRTKRRPLQNGLSMITA